ncbi:MAG TPA: ABC-type transport auxiliary lipoprotein family protein [Labilithrix sp.]|nr:ABC-type transport auxiliary lipoprotein family protein [Labilithrix sp.]
MRAAARARALLVLPLLMQLGGCALTSKGTPMEVRYFSPESVDVRHVARQAQPPVARVRLGNLSSSANLRYPIVHRESAVELDVYDTLRWTENPEDYVRRSLARALFEDGQLEEVVGGAAVTLDVEVIAFEESRREGRHMGRVQLGYQLHDERSVLTSGVVTVERDAGGSSIEPVVAAIGAAMDAATSELAANVLKKLRAR